MKKRILVIVGLLTLSFVAWLYIVTPSQQKLRADVNRHVFDSIKKDSGWDMQKPMLYGFFFTGDHEVQLKVLGFLLRLGGHRVVEVSKDTENEFYWLHVERNQVHDLDSISRKDVRLSRIGAICMSAYDGWDVGPDLTPTKPKSQESAQQSGVAMQPCSTP